jgi:hypothetical protein
VRKFKTICHNNQYKDCGVTPEQRERERGGFLLADSRPTSSGTLLQFTMGSGLNIGIPSIKTPLEVGKGYSVVFHDHGEYSIVDSEGSHIYLITEACTNNTREMIISLYDEESIMGIRFSDFFYTEEQLRENKINNILD